MTSATPFTGYVGLALAKTSPLPGSDSAPIAPSITSQPSGRTVKPGQTATFAVVASGTAMLSYQWKLNGAAIVGATSSVYTTGAVTVADSGAQFSVTVSSPAGVATSRIETLTVLVTLPKGDPPASALDQNERVRTSRFLTNSYAGLQIGSIGYAFSSTQLQPGFQVQSVQISHIAARVVLYGHDFNKYISAQVSEMRPVQWVMYKGVSGDMGTHTVWMNIGGLTAKARLPLSAKWSLFGEGGLGIVTRKGFDINGSPVVTGTSYATLLYGGGLDYSVNHKWDLLASVAVAPGNAASQQPSTVFYSGGFNYTLRRVPAEPAGPDSSNGPLWPKNLIQVGYISDVSGYAVNNAVAKAYLFWSGNVEVANGLSADYQRNLFHTRRFFCARLGRRHFLMEEQAKWREVLHRVLVSRIAVSPGSHEPGGALFQLFIRRTIVHHQDKH